MRPTSISMRLRLPRPNWTRGVCWPGSDRAVALFATAPVITQKLWDCTGASVEYAERHELSNMRHIGHWGMAGAYLGLGPCRRGDAAHQPATGIAGTPERGLPSGGDIYSTGCDAAPSRSVSRSRRNPSGGRRHRRTDRCLLVPRAGATRVGGVPVGLRGHGRVVTCWSRRWTTSGPEVTRTRGDVEELLAGVPSLRHVKP